MYVTWNVNCMGILSLGIKKKKVSIVAEFFPGQKKYV